MRVLKELISESVKYMKQKKWWEPDFGFLISDIGYKKYGIEFIVLI
jgi:hypothetical protein